MLTCFDNTIERISMSSIEALVLEGKIDMSTRWKCTLYIQASNLNNINFIYIDIIDFSSSPKETKQIPDLILNASIPDIKKSFIITSETSSYEKFISNIINKYTDIKLYGLFLNFEVEANSTANIKISITNIYNCVYDDTVLVCNEIFNSTNICISKSLKCDSYYNCKHSKLDEQNCNPPFDYTFFIPIFIIGSLAILLLMWTSYRMVHCSPLSDFVGSSRGARIAYGNLLSMPMWRGRRRNSRANDDMGTPDGLIPAPPPYTQSVFSSMSNVPAGLSLRLPTYSFSNEPGVYPKFYRYIGGLSKTTTK